MGVNGQPNNTRDDFRLSQVLRSKWTVSAGMREEQGVTFKEVVNEAFLKS